MYIICKFVPRYSCRTRGMCLLWHQVWNCLVNSFTQLMLHAWRHQLVTKPIVVHGTHMSWSAVAISLPSESCESWALAKEINMYIIYVCVHERAWRTCLSYGVSILACPFGQMPVWPLTFPSTLYCTLHVVHYNVVCILTSLLCIYHLPDAV